MIEKLALTGIPVLDGIVQLVLGVILGYLFIISVARMVRLFQNHQYGQLIATVVVFFCLFFFITKPQTVSNWFSSSSSTVTTQVGGTGK